MKKVSAVLKSKTFIPVEVKFPKPNIIPKYYQKNFVDKSKVQNLSQTQDEPSPIVTVVTHNEDPFFYKTNLDSTNNSINNNSNNNGTKYKYGKYHKDNDNFRKSDLYLNRKGWYTSLEKDICLTFVLLFLTLLY